MTCLASPILQPLFDGRPRNVHTQRARWLVLVEICGCEQCKKLFSATCHSSTKRLVSQASSAKGAACKICERLESLNQRRTAQLAAKVDTCTTDSSTVSGLAAMVRTVRLRPYREKNVVAKITIYACVLSPSFHIHSSIDCRTRLKPLITDPPKSGLHLYSGQITCSR